MDRRIWAHLVLLIVALIYGGNYVVAKIVMEAGVLQPLPFILLRASVGTFLFWTVYLLLKPGKIESRDIPRLVLCGLFGIAINQMCFFIGLNKTSPVNASLIMTTTPILVLLASALLLGEKINFQKLLGIGLGATGAILLFTQGQSVQFGGEGLAGDLLVLVNASSYGLYLVIVKPLMSRYHPLTVITWVFTFGLLFVIPFGSRGFFQTDWTAINSTSWWAIAYVVFLVTFLVYLLNAAALKEVSPSVVSIYIYVQPLVAGLLSVVLGRESIDAVKIYSTLLIFSGVFLVSGLGKTAQKSIAQSRRAREIRAGGK